MRAYFVVSTAVAAFLEFPIQGTWTTLLPRETWQSTPSSTRPVVNDQALPRSFALKRLFDLAVSAVGLLTMLIPCFWIAWHLVEESGWPIFYIDRRMGRSYINDRGEMRHREIYVIKFRTMQNGMISGPFACFLRSSHLDEVPQFLNVLLGEMSLVGPRALPWNLALDQLSKFPEYWRRFTVPQGLTGFTQIFARLEQLGEESAASMDVSYANRGFFWGDLMIIARTPFEMFLRKNGV